MENVSEREVLRQAERALRRMESLALERLRLEPPGGGTSRTLEQLVGWSKEAQTLLAWLRDREKAG